jgi:hypothetical protein
MLVNGQAGRYLYIHASQHDITATPELISIGCERHPPSHWLSHYKTIGKKNGYSPEQIAEYGAILSLFKNWK